MVATSATKIISVGTESISSEEKSSAVETIRKMQKPIEKPVSCTADEIIAMADGAKFNFLGKVTQVKLQLCCNILTKHFKASLNTKLF